MPHQGPRKYDSGAILIVIMIGVAIAMIGLGVAAQAWSTTWRRDSEEELIFRGTQYVNAILAYQKEHGGQYPIRLEDLYKPGPRRLRYIRKLFKDPVNRDGKWGLLYLMPGGRGIYDPKAAQKAQEKAAKDGWDDEIGANAGAQTSTPGVTPFSNNLLGSGVPGAGVPGAGGLVPGALPPGALPPVPAPDASGAPGDEESVSEPPIGWPIVGVISRASGKAADKTYRIYKGHPKVDEWQFQVFDFGAQQPQVPGQGVPAPTMPQRFGPGFGGQGVFGGPGITPRAGHGFGGGMGGGNNPLYPNQPGFGGGNGQSGLDLGPPQGGPAYGGPGQPGQRGNRTPPGSQQPNQ